MNLFERTLAQHLPIALAGSLLLAGAAWRECVLFAAAVLVAVHAFHALMDAGAPWQGWRAAARCWLMGCVDLLAAVALLTMVAGVWLEWWRPAHRYPLAGMAILAVVALACWWRRPRDGGRHPHDVAALAMLLPGGGALLAVAQGWPPAACLFAAATALLVGAMGWRLVGTTAGELARADQRR